jgi:hypothetical protein
MKSIDVAPWFLVAGLTLLMSLTVVASENQETKGETRSVGQQKEELPLQKMEAKNDKQVTPRVMPRYKPPRLGAPAGRVAGGTRGFGDRLPFVCVLAPDHTGLTVREQPTLYWFLSEPTDYPVEFTLIESWGIQPLVETALRLSAQRGVQAIRLADHGVRLQPGVEYKWFVALVPDRHHRSRDIITAGEIALVEPSDALRKRLAGADKMQAVLIYAEEGIWYDALTSLSELIEATPKDRILREQRAFLLRQIGLPQVAQFDVEQTVSGGQ